LKSIVTLKPCLGVTQGHWKWHYSIDSVWLPIKAAYFEIKCQNGARYAYWWTLIESNMWSIEWCHFQWLWS